MTNDNAGILVDAIKIQAYRTLTTASFYEFVQCFWETIIPEKPIWNWHIKYICDEMQVVGELIIKREPKLYDLVINVPPSSSKTTIVSVMFPVWLWVRDQSARIITSSYSADLSIASAIKSRDIINSDKFNKIFPNLIKFKGDQNNKSHYKNLKTGERLATSTGGTVTGFHGHVIIVDDPQNPQEAYSSVKRDESIKHVKETLSSRKVDERITPMIIVMQRLHEKDVSGTVLQEFPNVKHICIPAELSENVKPESLRGFYKNELLDPVRLSAEILSAKKKILGEYGYAGQYGQKPVPDGGGLWKEDWFIPLKVTKNDVPLDLEELSHDWDLAYTDKESNSASAFVKAARSQSSGLIYILDCDYRWLEFPELVNWMLSIGKIHHIEQKASGKSAAQVLQRHGVSAIEVPVEGGDKLARTKLKTPLVESGRIRVLDTCYDKLLFGLGQGLLTVSHNNFTDLNDAFTQTLTRLDTVVTYEPTVALSWR